MLWGFSGLHERAVEGMYHRPAEQVLAEAEHHRAEVGQIQVGYTAQTQHNMQVGRLFVLSQKTERVCSSTIITNSIFANSYM